jgi:hypothetical protein
MFFATRKINSNILIVKGRVRKIEKYEGEREKSKKKNQRNCLINKSSEIFLLICCEIFDENELKFNN